MHEDSITFSHGKTDKQTDRQKDRQTDIRTNMTVIHEKKIVKPLAKAFISPSANLDYIIVQYNQCTYERLVMLFILIEYKIQRSRFYQLVHILI